MTIHFPPRSDVVGEIEASVHDFIALRRELHRQPELAFHEAKTSTRIGDLLEGWGFDVTRGVGRTGLVASLSAGASGRSLGIRADFDALPIAEATGLDHASQNAGKMHACGHDGHTAILLAAAHHLARTRRFDGTLRLFFQPAEEIGAGAKAMLADGALERFPVDAIFGLHNWPGVPAGHFGFVTGPAMASVDKAIIKVIGHGGHGAAPHETVDPVVAAAHIITALQTLVSRNVHPLDTAVVTVGSIHGGSASNVIPESVELQITIRSFKPDVRALLQRRLPALVVSQAASFGARAEVDYRLGFPSVVNSAWETDLARDVAVSLFGNDQVVQDFQPRTASEDFAYFLERRPGSFVFVGNGPSSPLHSPHYDFNDAVIAPAAAFWVGLAERYLASPGAP